MTPLICDSATPATAIRPASYPADRPGQLLCGFSAYSWPGSAFLPDVGFWPLTRPESSLRPLSLPGTLVSSQQAPNVHTRQQGSSGATVGPGDRYQRHHDFEGRIVEPTPDKGDHLASVEEFTDAEPAPTQAAAGVRSRATRLQLISEPGLEGEIGGRELTSVRA